MVVMITGPSFQNISWGTYIGTLGRHSAELLSHLLSQFLQRSMRSLYLSCTYSSLKQQGGRLKASAIRCPELPLAMTNMLETDMDVVFALAYNEGVSPVAVSLRKDIPQAGSPEANEILGLSDVRA